MALQIQLCVLAIILVHARAAVYYCGVNNESFRCQSGQCLPGALLCNDVEDCPDGSDEELSTCHASNITLNEGYRRTVRLQCNYVFIDFELLICNGMECNVLSVGGIESREQLLCAYGVGCNVRGNSCQDKYTRLSAAYPLGSWSLPGQVVFEVERLAFQLAVWMQGHADKQLLLPAPSGYDQLWVRPRSWSQTTVQVDDVPCQKNQTTCTNGQCLDVSDKCNGRVECSDGSDEWPSVCSAANTTLFVWDSITANVHLKREHEAVDFQLCNQSDCSVLRVWGDQNRQNASFKFYTRHERASSPSSSQNLPLSFAFDVEHGEFDLAVWPRGLPGDNITVPAPRHHTLLRVRPYSWKTAMTVDFSGIRGRPVGHIDCGQRTPSLELTVVGGQNVINASEFPWHVMVFRDRSPICGGSLISPRFFISAGHCFVSLDKGEPLTPSNFRAAVGKESSLIDAAESYTQLVNVERIFIHDDFRGGQMWYFHDIALVRMSRDVQLSPAVIPICVDWDANEEPLRKLEDIAVVGVGLGKGKISDYLHSANVTYLPLDDCKKEITGKTGAQVVIRDKFCVGGDQQGNAVLAQGDSGGGLSILRSDRWFLVGIVSINYGPRSFATNVTTYISWFRNGIRTYLS